MASQYPGKDVVLHFVKTRVSKGTSPFRYIACTWQGRELDAGYKPTTEEQEKCARLYWDKAINSRDNSSLHQTYTEYIESGDAYSESALESPQSPSDDSTSNPSIDEQLKTILAAEPAPLLVLRNSEHDAAVNRLAEKIQHMSTKDGDSDIGVSVVVPAAVSPPPSSSSDKLLKKALLKKVTQSTLLESRATTSKEVRGNDHEVFAKWPVEVKHFLFWTNNISNNERKQKEFGNKWDAASDAQRLVTLEKLYGYMSTAKELHYWEEDHNRSIKVGHWLYSKINLLEGL